MDCQEYRPLLPLFGQISRTNPEDVYLALTGEGIPDDTAS